LQQYFSNGVHLKMIAHIQQKIIREILLDNLGLFHFNNGLM